MNWEQRLETIPIFSWDAKEHNDLDVCFLVDAFYLREGRLPIGGGSLLTRRFIAFRSRLYHNKVSNRVRTQYAALLSMIPPKRSKVDSSNWGATYSEVASALAVPYWWRTPRVFDMIKNLRLGSPRPGECGQKRRRLLAVLPCPPGRTAEYEFLKAFDHRVAEYVDYTKRNGFRPPRGWYTGWVEQAQRFVAASGQKDQQDFLRDLLSPTGTAQIEMNQTWERRVTYLLSQPNTWCRLSPECRSWMRSVAKAQQSKRLSPDQIADAKLLHGLNRLKRRVQGGFSSQHPRSKLKTKP